MYDIYVIHPDGEMVLEESTMLLPYAENVLLSLEEEGQEAVMMGW